MHTCRYPHTRTALIATNLVSPKVVDGISRLLVKSDVDRLKSKERSDALDKCEESMSHAWDLLMQLHQQSKLGADEAYALLGRKQTRTILYLTQKSKQGFEKREFQSLQEIQAALMDELKGMVPAEAIASPWLGSSELQQTQEPSEASSASSATSAALPLTLAQLQNPSWVAGQSNFIAGRLAYEKSRGSNKLYKITQLDEGGAELVHHNLGRGEPERLKVDIEVLLKTWCVFKGEAPVALPAALSEWSVQRKSLIDSCKACLFNDLTKHCLSHHDAHQSLAYSLFPNEVRTARVFKKGELVLAPWTELKNMHAVKRGGASSAGVECQALGQSLWLHEPTRPRTAKPTDWPPTAVLVGYWWVGVTNQAEAGNMEVSTVKMESSTFKVLTNSRRLLQHERLLLLKQADCSTQPPKKRKGQ